MKKLVLLCMLVSFGFGEKLVCKSERDLYLIADSFDRVAVAKDLIYSGKCKIIYGGKVIYKGKHISKIRYGSEVFYTLSAYLR